MSNYIDRLISEKQEIEERVEKLDKFINGPMFGDINEKEQELQTCQLSVMQEYLRILKARLKLHHVKA